MEVTCDLPTTLTVAARALFTELTLVSILVTAQALTRHWLVSNHLNRNFVLNDHLARQRLVTFGTLHIRVLKLNFVVTLPIVFKLYRLPLHVTMAFEAVLTELTFVDVAVACQTLVLIERRKDVLILEARGLCVELLSRLNVTLFAVHIGVRTRQRVTCFRVIKRKSLIPIRSFVACDTGTISVGVQQACIELAFVRRRMAFRAELFLEVLVLVDLSTVFLVTIEALHFRVGTVERKSRLRVIERFAVFLTKPIIRRVALGTTFRQKLGRELTDMWVRVTQDALFFRQRFPMVDANRKLRKRHRRRPCGLRRFKRSTFFTWGLRRSA